MMRSCSVTLMAVGSLVAANCKTDTILQPRTAASAWNSTSPLIPSQQQSMVHYTQQQSMVQYTQQQSMVQYTQQSMVHYTQQTRSSVLI